MQNNPLHQFIDQDFLNIETFRKNGQGVPTPVWFVEEAGMLYVRTGASSGKVKRLLNNSRVRVVPCKMQGKLIGEWVEARAELVNGDQTGKVDRLLKQKYGVQKIFFDLFGRMSNAESVTIAIKLAEE